MAILTCFLIILKSEDFYSIVVDFSAFTVITELDDWIGESRLQKLSSIKKKSKSDQSEINILNKYCVEITRNFQEDLF